MFRPILTGLMLTLALGVLAACQMDQPPQLPPAGKAMSAHRDDACVASGGVWSNQNGKQSKVCIHYTTDARKMCTRSSQCQGACLARSHSCSPVRPLLGCQDILTDSGLRMTQCVN